MVPQGEVPQALPHWRYGQQGGLHQVQERGHSGDPRMICSYLQSNNHSLISISMTIGNNCLSYIMSLYYNSIMLQKVSYELKSRSRHSGCQLNS